MYAVKFDNVMKPCGQFSTIEKARWWAQQECDGFPYLIVRHATE